MYSTDDPPDWLKNLPKGAIKIGVKAFNAAYEKDKDDDAARKAAWGAIKSKYEKDGDAWRAKQDVSLDDVRQMLHEAIQKGQGKEAWVSEVYGSYLIFTKDAKYFRLPWSILDGEVQLGSEPVEVERTWVETRSQQAADGQEMDDGLELEVRLGQAQDVEGTEWEVTICKPGFTKNGWYIPDDALREAQALFEGVDVNLYQLSADHAGHVPESLMELKEKSAGNKVGWIDTVKHAAGKGLKGVLHFLDSAKYLGKNLVTAKQQGHTPYGLSYDCSVRAKKSVIDGKKVWEIVRFVIADSVDIVTRPAAGGKFNRAIAAQKEEVMDKKELWEMISEARPDLLKGKDVEFITDDEIKTLARMAMEPVKAAANDGDGGGDGDNGNGTGGDNEPAKDDPVALLRCEMALERKLGASDLPELAQKRIRKVFEGKVFRAEELDQAVADEKDYLAKMAQPEGGDGGQDQARASGARVGIGTLERAQMAMDRSFGLRRDDMLAMARTETLQHQPFFDDRLGAAGFCIRSIQDLETFDDVPAFRGLRDMYTFFTGDPDVTGFFNRKRLPAEFRARMDFTSSTFTYALANTMGRRLVKEFREPKFREELLISVRKPVKDFRTQEAVKLGGFADIDTVDPETSDYDEISAITDEQVTYVLATRGNILTITRVMVINDDINLVTRGLAKVGRAIRRTHGKYVWGMYIDNDTCTDGTAVFTSGHGNLGSSALSHSTALTAWKALAAMTEKDSGEYLGMLDGDQLVNVIGPPALKETINKVEKEEFYYSSDDLTTKEPNALLGLVKGHTLSLLAGDSNDWYMTLPPDVGELVEMGYLNGRQEPEFIVADSPQAEQVFVGDKIRHKFRHEYAGAPITFENAYKGAV